MGKRRENKLLFLAWNLKPELHKFLNQWECAENKEEFLLTIGDFKRLRYSNFEAYVGNLRALDVSDLDTIEVEIFIMEQLSNNINDKGNSEHHRAGVDYVIEQFVDVSLLCLAMSLG